MTERAKVLAVGTLFLAHWTGLHLAVGWLVLRELRKQPWWFLGAEALLVLSFLLGFRAMRTRRLPSSLANLGTELIRERDFTSKFRPTGASAVDELIDLYNQMVQRLREERLLSSERNYFLERLLEAAPVAILILDHDGGISQVNPQARILLDLRQSIVGGESLAVLGRPLGDALRQLETSDPILLNLGGRRLKLSAGNFFDRGFPRRFFVIEELTAELWESEREAYGRLIRTISHEVGNSVGAVGSLLESCTALAEGLPEEESASLKNSLSVAGSRLRSLNSFINGFAEVVRLPEPVLRSCDLVALLDDILVLLGPELESSRIAVFWEKQEGAEYSVLADKNQLEQLLVNVLRNAIEAIVEGGEITFELSTEASQTRLSIRDDGTGISEAVRDQLFVPFVSTKRDGRGLGLTLVREIAAKHDWSIGLVPWSTGQRSGTEFWLKLLEPQSEA